MRKGELTCGIVEGIILIDRPDHRPAETPFVCIVELDLESLLIVIGNPLVTERKYKFLRRVDKRQERNNKERTRQM